MLNEGLDLKLWWANPQVLERGPTASRYVLLLPSWSLPLCRSGTKSKTGHGCTDRLPSLWQWPQLLLSSGLHWSAKGWGWQGFSYPCCQPHFVMNIKMQTDNHGQHGSGQLSFSSCNPRKAKSRTQRSPGRCISGLRGRENQADFILICSSLPLSSSFKTVGQLFYKDMLLTECHRYPLCGHHYHKERINIQPRATLPVHWAPSSFGAPEARSRLPQPFGISC